MSDQSIADITVTAAGAQPTPPQTLLAKLIALVAGVRQGYTANLPGSLIEDISSTDTGALVLADQAAVELLNSLTPLGANAFLSAQLGAMLGIDLGEASNTSVFVQFSGPPGFVIAKGFTVGDGTFQYVVQDGGIIASDGQSLQLFAVATIAGTWAVPAGTVTNLITSVPATITLSVVNPEPGTPGIATGETQAAYRARVLQANLAASQGMSRYLKTKTAQVPGVQARLISAVAQEGGGWKIIVGGGDPYLVAYAIYDALFDVSTLVGSQINITAITSANPGVVTTDLNHGYSVGQAIVIDDVDPMTFDGSFTVQAVPDEKTFALGNAYPAQNVTAASWSGSDVTATFAVDHGVSVGSTFVISGFTPSGYNGTHVAIAGTTGTTLVWASSDPGLETILGQLLAGIALVDTTALTYISDGSVSPNFRNIVTTVTDWPDTYPIPSVNPPQQSVAIAVTWNTSSINVVSPAAVAQLAIPAIVDYVNAIFVGQPINLFVLQEVFADSIASLVPRALLTRMVFAVSINGVGVSPESGTGIIAGDPESYFFITAADVTVSQG